MNVIIHNAVKDLGVGIPEGVVVYEVYSDPGSKRKSLNNPTCV